MSAIRITDLVRPMFRASLGRGLVSMLECYFDDSGTHDGSKIAVWGGLIGQADRFDQFTIRWNALLSEPLPGKPPLKKMHLAALRNAKGEFFGYNQAEIDLLTKKFRDVIVESGLECIAYIVSVEDWLRASTELERSYLGDARNFAFYGVIEAIAALAKLNEGGLSCHFDKGAQDEAMRVIQSVWEMFRSEESKKATFAFSAVEMFAGLQGADMVAYEAYHYGLHLIDPSYPENPHFIDLRNRTNVAFLSLHEPEMRAHLVKWRAAMSELFSGFG